jgi:hypothetical protein
MDHRQFRKDEISLGKTKIFTWSRQEEGNHVYVVIDDDCHFMEDPRPDSLDINIASLSQLHKQFLSWSDTRAVGFFPLLLDTKEVLKAIENFLTENAPTDGQLYFLVDAVYGPPGNENVEPANSLVKQLGQSQPAAHVAYLTKAGSGIETELVTEYQFFKKADEANAAKRHGQFTPVFMSWLGKGRHEDGIIDDAIQFYEKAWNWNERWKVKGWAHDCLQEEDTKHLEELATWLNLSIDDVYKSPKRGESAKSLMIWRGAANPWENPPWEVRDRRRIQGRVLNAVLNKLNIRLTQPVREETCFTMPCVPCFPFLVSLRSFLWHCEKEEVAIGSMNFFQFGKDSQVYMFCLILPNDFDCVELARNFYNILESDSPNDDPNRDSTFSRSLRELTHSRTIGLKKGEDIGEGQEYMCLFGSGTELPVVSVEIAPHQINLIWTVG